jgi:hypothetical protein
MPNGSFFGISLNPGPFTIKEHVIIAIMASPIDQTAYAVCTEFGKLCHVIPLTPLLDWHYFGPEGCLQSASQLRVYVPSQEAFDFQLFISFFTEQTSGC